jgi:hypothetical protein
MAPRMIPNWIGKAMPIVTLLLVALVSLPAESAMKKAPPKGTGNPFDLLNGYWSGGRTVAPGKGNPEKVSCRVTYNVAGSAVTQNMRCASTDYKFNTASKLTYDGGKINGSWSETTYDAAGSVNGTAAGNTVQAIISGDKFSGRMSINVSGLSHTMNIVQFDPKSGSYRQAASVSLHRSRALFHGSADRGLMATPTSVAPSVYVILRILSVVAPGHANHSWPFGQARCATATWTQKVFDLRRRKMQSQGAGRLHNRVSTLFQNS